MHHAEETISSEGCVRFNDQQITRADIRIHRDRSDRRRFLTWPALRSFFSSEKIFERKGNNFSQNVKNKFRFCYPKARKPPKISYIKKSFIKCYFINFICIFFILFPKKIYILYIKNLCYRASCEYIFFIYILIFLGNYLNFSLSNYI